MVFGLEFLDVLTSHSLEADTILVVVFIQLSFFFNLHPAIWGATGMMEHSLKEEAV